MANAVPITFGLKVAVWVDEFRRHIERLVTMRPRITAGKFLGAVGTGRSRRRRAKAPEPILQELGLEVPVALRRCWKRPLHRVGRLDGKCLNQYRKGATRS